MKRISNWILATIMLVAIASAQEPRAIKPEGPGFTFELINGRTWKDISMDIKAAWVLGYREGVYMTAWVYVDATKRDACIHGLSGSLLTNYEIAKAIDHFYEDPLNIPIPVASAFKIVVELATGVDPSETAKVLRVLREEANKRKGQ
jgi:hypothetical protein